MQTSAQHVSQILRLAIMRRGFEIGNCYVKSMVWQYENWEWNQMRNGTIRLCPEYFNPTKIRYYDALFNKPHFVMNVSNILLTHT